MSAHTPGPWALGTSYGLTSVTIVGDDGNIAIGSVIVDTLSKKATARYGATEPYPEGEANARLVVASPDLLAALVGLRADLRAAWDAGTLPASAVSHERICEVDAAIAKATGSSP